MELGQPRPNGIRLPNGTKKPVKYWKDLLIHTAEYLVGAQMLTANSGPINAAGNNRALVSNTPRDPEKKHPKESNHLAQNLYLEIKLSSPWCLNKTKHLLSKFDINLDQVQIQIS